MKLSFRRRFSFAMVAATVFGSYAAMAEPPTRAQKDAAEHNKRAFEAVRRADAETARLEFLQAYALVPSPKTLWNLLVAEADTDHPLDALKHLRLYLADPAADPKKSERAQHLLRELTAQVGHLQIVGPEGPVRVDGLVISSDQRANGIDVAPGKHVVELAMRTGAQRREADAVAGAPTVVTFDEPADAQPVEAPAAEPVVAPVPQEKPVIPPARIASGGISPPPLATWILGTAAVAALGTGIAFSLSAKSKRDEIDESPKACANPSSPECAHIEDLRDSGSRDTTVAWIAYGTAGAAVVAGGLIWYFSPKKTPASRDATLAPLISPGMSGVQVRATF